MEAPMYLDRFTPLMSEALHCAGSPEALAMPLEEIQASLLRLAEEERARPLAPFGAPDEGAAREALDQCRFAVYAWADERMLNADRPDAPLWMGLSLQHRFFATAEGGQRFFVRLEELLDSLGVPRERNDEPLALDRRLELAARIPADAPGRDTLAVFALCLLYGFSGRLHGEPELLSGIRKAAHALLPKEEEQLAESRARRAREGGQALLRNLEPLLYMLVPLAVTFLFALYCAAVLADVPVHGL